MTINEPHVSQQDHMPLLTFTNCSKKFGNHWLLGNDFCCTDAVKYKTMTFYFKIWHFIHVKLYWYLGFFKILFLWLLSVLAPLQDLVLQPPWFWASEETRLKHLSLESGGLTLPNLVSKVPFKEPQGMENWILEAIKWTL